MAPARRQPSALLLGLLKPTSGTAAVLGFDIVRQNHEVKKRIGYMSQRFSLYDDLTVEENLNFYGRTYGVRGRRLQARKELVLQMAGLNGRKAELTRKPGRRLETALGPRRGHYPRAGDALPLTSRPPGVIDLTPQLLAPAVRPGRGREPRFMVTTHYMDEAEHCQNLAFIQGGRIVAQGSPAVIKDTKCVARCSRLDCDRPAVAIPALRQMGVFDEVALYGALVHRCRTNMEGLKPQVETVLDGARGRGAHDGNHCAVAGRRIHL